MSTKSAPHLSVRPEKNSPLAKLLRARRQSEDFTRARRLSRLLEMFHLKFCEMSHVRGRFAVVNGKSVINFGSADYLGLEQHPEVCRAVKDAVDKIGTHPGALRVELERGLSGLVGAEDTLVSHNVAHIHADVLPALFGDEECVVFVDCYAHSTLQQAALAANAKGARIVTVDTENPELLERAIQENKRKYGALLIDGVHSMQGSEPALIRFDEICRREGLLLYLDDSHGIGILGEHGGGSVEACGLSFDNILLVGNLQKSLGSYGGFISGSRGSIDFLRSASRTSVFSGTLPATAIEGARAALQVVLSVEGRRLRHQLRANSRWLRARLTELGFTVPSGDTPVVSVLIGTDMITLMAGRYLFDHGIYVNSVIHPSVPSGQSILRISLTSLHTPHQMRTLVEGFLKLSEYLALIRRPMVGPAHIAWQVTKSKFFGPSDQNV